MPFVHIRATPKTREQVEKMMEGITKVVAETCNLNPDVVWVVYEEVPSENWAVGGKPLGKPKKQRD